MVLSGLPPEGVVVGRWWVNDGVCRRHGEVGMPLRSLKSLNDSGGVIRVVPVFERQALALWTFDRRQTGYISTHLLGKLSVAAKAEDWAREVAQ